MLLRYIGPHDAVEVPLPDGSQPEVEREKTLEVSDREFAERLLEQTSNWELAKPAKEKPAKDAPAKKADESAAKEVSERADR
jgi:hypothetical protein